MIGNEFLPVSRADMEKRGWERCDFIIVSSEAYVDHPSFGAAVLSRLLEDAGYHVGIIAQPDWRDAANFKVLGRPRLGFLVCPGVMDSLVRRYTAARKPRSQDAYSPGQRNDMFPDRCSVVYSQKLREAYGRKTPIIIGGVEASLRRFAHYDYWDDRVRRSVLCDSDADLLVYGMGETPLLEIAEALDGGLPPAHITWVRGSCYLSPSPSPAYETVELPSFEQVTRDVKAYCKAFTLSYDEQDAVRGRALLQDQGRGILVQNPPSLPLSSDTLDHVAELPYCRAAHPIYPDGIAALEEVQFSLQSSRGCFGSCSFCSITFHQGRVVQSRSHQSLLREAELLTQLPGFKGYIHDVGGPTANFRQPACAKQLTQGACAHRQCLSPEPCPSLRADHRDYLALLRKLRALPKIKKVFIRSGLRYDFIMADRDSTFMRELCEHHISGQLKVAPEHISSKVLANMGKPGRDVYDAFTRKYENINHKLGKEQYIVPYLMSGHPGSGMPEAIELAQYLREHRLNPQQVQDFYPTPGTLSTCMYYTGLDPRTLTPVAVPKGREKVLQRALLQPQLPKNKILVREALRKASREDLIGWSPNCLVTPYDKHPKERRP